MIYQPRNVQPSGVSIDGLLDNTFTMEVQTNSYVSAYQLLIVDFDNNAVYTGAKTTLAKYAYNGDTLEIPVSASTVALSNGTNYKWRVRLYQPTADMLITYGLVQSTSTTTTVYLQPNINIKAGMSITINNQTKTISSYNSDTGVAVVSSALSSAPAVGTQYKIYSDFIETVPDYIVYARRTPAVSINNVPSSLTLKYHTFQGTYTQSDNVAIVYHQFDLYMENDDDTVSLVNSSGKVYSANLSYTYDSFRTGNTYFIQMTIENDMGVITTTDMYEFNVSYDIVEYLQQPLAAFDNKNNAVQVSWVTPVENEATSLRSDAASGVIADNNNTYTQATFEPGQSIGEGDVIQLTNSNCDLYIEGRSEQKTRDGYNLLPITLVETTANGITRSANGNTIKLTGTATSAAYIYYFSGELKLKAGTYNFCFYGKKGSDLNFYYTANGTNVLLANNASTLQYATVTFDVDTTITSFWSFIANEATIDSELQLMITESDEEKPFEDYGVMPSPDFPSEIKSVGYTNVFNMSDTNNFVFRNKGNSPYYQSFKLIDYSANEIKVSGGGGNYTQAYIDISNLIPNTKYNLSYVISQNDFTFSPTMKLTSDTTDSDGKITVQLDLNNGSTAVDTQKYVVFTKIKLEEGLTINSYVPYGKYGIDIDAIGKNIFNKNKPNILNLYPGRTKFGYNKNYQSICVPIEPNTTYTVTSLNHYSDGLTLGTSEEYPVTDGAITNQLGAPKTQNNATITSGANDKYLLAYIKWTGSLTAEILEGIQIEKSKVPTKYEPFKSSISQIITNAPLRSLPNGVCDTYEDGKIIRRVGKLILDGNQNWFLSGGTTATKLIAVLDVSSIMPTKTYTGLSNRFIYQNGNEFPIGTFRLYNILDSGILQHMAFAVDTADIADIDAFKVWVNNNNIEVMYEMLEPITETVTNVSVPQVSGVNYMRIPTLVTSTFSLIYPHKTITGNTWNYTEFNPPGAKQTGTIKSYNAVTGVGVLMTQYPFTYVPMKDDPYIVTSNIYNVSGFSYLYDTPYNTVNSLYTHGYTATWSTPDGLCVLPDDFNITLQFSPDGNFYYTDDGVYQEVVNLITTETDDTNNAGEFTIKIDKNKLIFVQNPDISLELPFYTHTTQVFVLSSANIAQINNDYVWDDTATWTDTYTWVEGGTSLERVCNHWWKVQITKTGIKIEEIFPTT